jgi:hypothetical protein
MARLPLARGSRWLSSRSSRKAAALGVRSLPASLASPVLKDVTQVHFPLAHSKRETDACRASVTGDRVVDSIFICPRIFSSRLHHFKVQVARALTSSADVGNVTGPFEPGLVSEASIECAEDVVIGSGDDEVCHLDTPLWVYWFDGADTRSALLADADLANGYRVIAIGPRRRDSRRRRPVRSAHQARPVVTKHDDRTDCQHHHEGCDADGDQQT